VHMQVHERVAHASSAPFAPRPAPRRLRRSEPSPNLRQVRRATAAVD
jgi:hypothetical protein